jgi:hypothetical protein
MEGPPPARAPLGRPTVLTDLPGDVLAHILSFIPFEQRRERRIVASRFVAAAACTALAAAARPPSAAWTDVAIPEAFFVSPEIASFGPRGTSEAAQNALRDAMARAAPSVRRLVLHGASAYYKYSSFCTPALMAMMAAPAAPYLEELEIYMLYMAYNYCGSTFEPLVAAATRLTRLEMNKFRFEGPPPMIAAGRAAIIAFRRGVRIDVNGPSRSFFDTLLVLLRSLSAAATLGVGVEPPVLVRLEPLWLTPRMLLEQAACVRELTSVFGRHLTRLAVQVGTTDHLHSLLYGAADVEARTAVARLLENHALPSLRELVIDWESSSDSVRLDLDLAGVHAPPPGLTFLSVQIAGWENVLLSPAVRAGLASLAVHSSTSSIDPPQCLRGLGGSFGRLTRLVYSRPDNVYPSINLAPWGRPELSVPTLVEMEAIGGKFTLVGCDYGSWCEGFLASLPRLARLVLRAGYDAGPFRAATDGSMDAAAVEDMVTTRLPRAAREAGRRLDVAVHHSLEAGDPAALAARFGLRVETDLDYGFQLAFEARPPG